jgi:hypothetical protein
MTREEIIARLAWINEMLKALQKPKPSKKETRH